jgi:hypothetical protein
MGGICTSDRRTDEASGQLQKRPTIGMYVISHLEIRLL